MAGQLQQACLGGPIVERALLRRIVIQPAIGRNLAIHGGDVDDAGFPCRRHAGFQRGQRGAHRFKRGGDGAGIGGGEVFAAQAGEAFDLHRHRIVGQYVQALEAGEESARGARVRDIESGAGDGEFALFQPGLKCGQRGIVAAIDDDMGARFTQGLDHSPETKAVLPSRRKRCCAILPVPEPVEHADTAW
jgi:hypothetical protein